MGRTAEPWFYLACRKLFNCILLYKRLLDYRLISGDETRHADSHNRWTFSGQNDDCVGRCRAGFPIVHEFATEIIKEGVFLPWVDRCSFQNEVLRRQCAAEKELDDVDGPVFLDRGLFDGEAYYIYDKLEIPERFSQLDASKYALAFLVELLPFFDKNDVRREKS